MAVPEGGRVMLLGIGSGIVLGLMGLYVLNPSHVFTPGIGLLPRQHIGLLPAAAYGPGALRALGLALMVIVSVVSSAMLPAQCRRVLLTLVIAGAAIMALQVWVQRLTPRRFPVFAHTGIFVNPNHFAAFANLVIPLAVVTAMRSRINAFHRGRASSPAGLFLLAAGCLGVAVVLARSRAGMAILALQATGFLLLWWRLEVRYPFALPTPSGGVLRYARAVVVMVALVLVIGLAARSVGQLSSLWRDIEFRGTVAADVARMWTSNLWWGTGPGSFAVVFPYYQRLPVERYYFRHAHNEPLQFLAEFGLLGAGVLGTGLMLIGVGLRGSRRDDTGILPSALLEGPACILALIGVGLHGLVDFPFRHPLMLLMVSLWLGMLLTIPRTPDRIP